MIKDTKETDFPPGEEGDSSEIGKVVAVTSNKASSSSTPTVVSTTTSTTTTNPTPWLRLKDPRIVRVSRVFGGKDRHSKVCTVRGLRDRRVRLSVPTAIQLYDLQDRLGLNQPSKVVDWLLDAAKHEIDELPPLSMPPGNFSLLMPPREPNAGANDHHHQGLAKSNANNSDHHGTTVEWDQSRLGWSNFWTNNTTSTNTSSDHTSSALWRTRSKEVIGREMADGQKENLRGGGTRNNNNVDDDDNDDDDQGSDDMQRTNNMINNHHPFFPGMLNNIANNLPNSFRWPETPNYPLLMSHLGGGSGGGVSIGHGLTDHNLQSLSNVAVSTLQPSTLSLSTGSSQYLLCPHRSSSSSSSATASTNTTTTTQTYFPNLLELHDPRQASHSFQMMSSNSVQNLFPNPMRSFFHFGSSTNDNDPGNENGNSTTDHQRSKERE